MVKKKQNEQPLVPERRFPEFQEEWEYVSLGSHADIIKKRAGIKKYTVMSIETGVGLVSQLEKFGRDISGNSYKNYTVIQKDDFAYNKSATKEFPEGFVAKHEEEYEAAVPNSIFTCFRLTSGEIQSEYLYFQLLNNLHGKWLRKFITVGARAHGALSVNTDDLLNLPVPVPLGQSSIVEQKKIADCLGSLDNLIGAHSRKRDALQDHKKGLLQQLFPAEGQTTPKLRFPEFEDAGEWKKFRIDDVFKTSSGGTPSRQKSEYWGGDIPWISTSLIDFNRINNAKEMVTEEGIKKSSAKKFPPETILIAMYGQGKTRGKVGVLGIHAATNQACAAILPSKQAVPNFVFQNLASRYEELRSLSNDGGQKNLSQSLIRELPICIPSEIKEQQKIADCLSSFDALITAQTEQIAALKKHKKGLMQQLFPNPELNKK